MVKETHHYWTINFIDDHYGLLSRQVTKLRKKSSLLSSAGNRFLAGEDGVHSILVPEEKEKKVGEKH